MNAPMSFEYDRKKDAGLYGVKNEPPTMLNHCHKKPQDVVSELRKMSIGELIRTMAVYDSEINYFGQMRCSIEDKHFRALKVAIEEDKRMLEIAKVIYEKRINTFCNEEEKPKAKKSEKKEKNRVKEEEIKLEEIADSIATLSVTPPLTQEESYGDYWSS